MNNISGGFILLMTLLIILVISLLVLTCMQHVLLYYKAINTLEVQHQNFYQLEGLAVQIASAEPLALDEQCVVHGDMINQVMHQLIHNQGCSLIVGPFKYKYRVEDLDDFPCLVIQTSHGTFSTHHRRVSLVSLADKSPSALLQIRYITPINAQTCLGSLQLVTPGISSWRYFAAI